MRIGIVGCGYASDMYIRSLKRYPHLELVAATEIKPDRALQFGKYYSVKMRPTVDALLADPSIEMIVNLTNPRSHFEVTKASLEAGKHVYTEKPLAMTFSEGRTLMELASRKGLRLSVAPCGILGEAAQTLWRALRNGAIGTAHLAYAEFDDGPVQLQDPNIWHSPSGAPYPYRDEFETGYTSEHAGYYLTWLAAFFGPAKTMTTFAACLWPDKHVVPGEPLYVTVPDFSVACVTFESGLVARMTFGLVGPHNHSLRIVGEKGVLRVEECLGYSAPVFVDKYTSLKFRAERYPITRAYPFIKTWVDPLHRVYPPVKKVGFKKRLSRHRQDYARGISELARSIEEKRPSRLPEDFCLHVAELVWAIQNSTHSPYQVTTTFEPLQPMDDAAMKEVLSVDW